MRVPMGSNSIAFGLAFAISIVAGSAWAGRLKQYVEPVVSAYSDDDYQGKLNEKTVFNFKIPNYSDLRTKSDSQQIIKSCREAAGILGFKTELNAKNCKNCIDVLTMHKFEVSTEESSPRATCSSYYGNFYGSTTCYTYKKTFKQNDRWIGITFYDSAMKKSVHQIDVYSTGSISSVTKVALEMCFAALSEFPKKLENEKYRVSLDLEEERGEVASNAPKEEKKK